MYPIKIKPDIKMHNELFGRCSMRSFGNCVIFPRNPNNLKSTKILQNSFDQGLTHLQTIKINHIYVRSKCIVIKFKQIFYISLYVIGEDLLCAKTPFLHFRALSIKITRRCYHRVSMLNRSSDFLCLNKPEN